MRIYFVLAMLGTAWAQFVPPGHITVMPVILVPSNSFMPEPTVDDQWKLLNQLNDAKAAYSNMLHNRDTFTIANSFPVIIHDPNHTVSDYSTDNGQLAALKAMEYFGNAERGAPYDRYSSPYVYLVLAWSVGWQYNDNSTYGSTFNGGPNSGGGIVVLKHYPAFAPPGSPPTFADKLQSTMQHELGHAFGLPHTFGTYSDPNNDNQFNWCYGWSIMSYNPLHWTDQRTPASQLWLYRFPPINDKYLPANCDSSGWGTDAILLPEEINILSTNKRVFPNLYFDPEIDIPFGYSYQPSIPLTYELPITDWMEPGYQIPGDYAPTDLISAYTYDGESNGTAAANTIDYVIRKDDAAAGFDSKHMWRSSGTYNNTASLRLHFTVPVTLNGVVVHTGWGANSTEIADNVCITDTATSVQLLCTPIGADDTIAFNAHNSSDWQLTFHAKTGNVVTVRGVQLLTPDGEIFPHHKREEMLTQPLITTSSGETYSSRVGHVVGPTITPNTAAAGYDATTMWHSGNTFAWVSVQVTFPYPVTLNSVDVHSQHSGRYHVAAQTQVNYLDTNTNTFVNLKRKTTAPDDNVSFNQTKAATWRIDFLPADGWVTIRGLRFHTPVANAFYAGYPANPDALQFP